MSYDVHSWKILEAYFNTKTLVDHQISSFNHFITFGMQDIVNQESTIIVETKKDSKYVVEFGQITVAPPNIIEEDRTLHKSYPQDARLRNLNYDSALHCDITEIMYEKEKVVRRKFHRKVMIGRIPIMVGSEFCNLTKLSEREKIRLGECPNDPGGYFIIKGNEKVLTSQIRANYNKIFVLSQKGQKETTTKSHRNKKTKKYSYVAEVRSMSTETGHSACIRSMMGVNNRNIYFSLPNIKEVIPVGIVFKALGYLTDEEILGFIGTDAYPVRKYLRYILRDAFSIRTKEDALAYIGQYSKNVIPKEREQDYAQQVVEDDLFPHLGISGTIREQACFLGKIVRKLLLTVAGLRNEDDRDNYTNKRVEVAGILMYELFRNIFKKYTQDIQKALEKKKRYPDALSEISKDKNITKNFHTCFAIGNWGVQKNSSYVRAGVSQLLDRMTYGATLSHLRRILIPVGKEGKCVAIRQIHSSQFGFIDPCETPEGKKAGIVLNFALSTTVSTKIPAVYVKKVLEQCKTIIPTDEVNMKKMREMVAVYLNGMIVGYSEDETSTIEEITKLRERRLLNWQTSVAYDLVDHEINIFCDEGRFLRPLLRVDEKNQLTLPKQDKYDWDELLENGHVVYRDPSELENSVIAMTPERLKTQQSDYCEIHPCLMLGIMSGIIPFPDHSQSPRNCYQCLNPDELVVMANGERKAIKDIKEGESVISIDPKTYDQSITRVVNQYVRETNKKIITLQTKSGRKLTCTFDHPVLTSQGWMKAEEAEDMCVILKYEKNPVLNDGYCFEPVTHSFHSQGGMIADITTESDNHSFIAGDSFCVHNSSMGKQALGIPTLSYNFRADTILHVLYYPQRPLVSTKISDLAGFNKMPSGINAIVAVACYSG